MSTRLVFALGLLFATFANAAALVPAVAPKGPLPVVGIEVNQGQAKAEILFLGRSSSPFAVTAQSVIFSPNAVRQSFVGGNPNPVVRYSDALPGVANVFTGSDASKWVTGIKRYATARLVDVYPGIDVEYVVGADGVLKVRLVVREGADLNSVIFDVQGAGSNLSASPDGGIIFYTGNINRTYLLLYPPPGGARFEILSSTRFGLRGDSSAGPLTIELKPNVPGGSYIPTPRFTTDVAGNIFVATAAPDAAGHDARFPGERADACGSESVYGITLACTDVALYKFSPAGDFLFASYLSGRTLESVGFIGLASNGDVVVTGGTDSTDFPVTAGALQASYGGPPARAAGAPGDYFAARFDPATGALRTSTYFGGPNEEQQGVQTALGTDGSLYFLPFGPSSQGMPVVSGAVKTSCNSPCTNGYAAHLNASLSTLLYATYLPGTPDTKAKLHSDGSVYYGGTAEAGFPVSSGAYQQQVSGPTDGFIARLNPAGTALIFATYIGGATSDAVVQLAVAPDGSSWVAVQSFVECCENSTYRLVHLDALGTRILVERPYNVFDMTTDRDGNLIVLSSYSKGAPAPTEDALLRLACVRDMVEYMRISPNGALLYASFLPQQLRSGFDGLGSHGLPLFQVGEQRVEMVEDQPSGVYLGCVVDAAQFTSVSLASRGTIVTLIGSNLGPREPLTFTLVNGRVPTELGGTRVLVNGEPVPILFRSAGQVNAILPYSLQKGIVPGIRVEWNGSVGNLVTDPPATSAAVTLFRAGTTSIGDRLFDMAAALNEDGTVNSTANPAKGGSRVVLFGTGGGATSPPSEAGEVTSGVRTMVVGAQAFITDGKTDVPLVVEYFGGAPGLVAGVTQINVKLPDVLPTIGDLPPGVLPVLVLVPGSGLRETTFIAVAR